MSTFVLHGGKTSINSQENDIFYRHFSDLIDKQQVKILMCYWARNKSEWNSLFERDKSKVLNQTVKEITFSIAENKADLFTKLITHDVLYVSGGDAKRIEPLLPQLAGLKTLLKDKVYLGSSMGAFIASKNYVLSSDDEDSHSVHQGLGLVPINILCHWNVENNKQEKLKLLIDLTQEYPTITLNEGQIEIIQQ
jgi:peptidase E